MDELIPAATILLLRDEPAFEVLMVERHADIVFAGGALVFPGGRIDRGDHNHDWRLHCDSEHIPPEQLAPRIASIREAFEETGVLLVKRNGDGISREEALSLASWRSRVEADDSLFLEMVRGEGLTLNLTALHLFARWRPPKGVGHRRYDTWFFAARAPADQTARADGGEATEIVWTTPGAALGARDAGQRKMIYPTSRNVELLNVSTTADEVFSFAARRPIRIVEPQAIERDGRAFLTIPSDMGYPVTEEEFEKAMRS
ncbi:NUDIX hydrolase [Hyphococcus sp.]|uniref:NUDIX hydrolase n=1 Tax=Hyphococcus sp. TaxID=2038636 RepID=UPI00207E3000|nr:MAG: NUDIX hydrolase [Marinicaulis sp.]